jgi:hypothetical protein
MMRWFRPGGLAKLAVLIAVAAAGYALLVPAAADSNAPDELRGVVQLVWWALCQLVGLAVVLLLFRLTRLVRRS